MDLTTLLGIKDSLHTRQILAGVRKKTNHTSDVTILQDDEHDADVIDLDQVDSGNSS
jgi:hypothetical protein